MNFLFVAINAKYIHSNPAVHSLHGFAERVYPGASSVLECTINQSFHTILSEICEIHPEAIGISTYIWNIDLVRRLITELPKVLPETDIWLGGPEVSYDYAELLNEFPQLRGIIVGEGERTCTRIIGEYVQASEQSSKRGEGAEEPDVKIFPDCDDLPYEKDFSSIPNLALAERPEVVSQVLTDMDALPFIYDEGLEDFSHRIVYYESSRGCPFRCSYCLSSIDKSVRYRSLPFVFRELQFFLDEQVPQVKFIDRTFNSDKQRSKAILQYIQEHDNGITNFHFEITAEYLDDEEIELLTKMRPGQVQLEIGIQTTNLDTLQAISRPASIEKIRNVMQRLTASHNLKLHLDLIAGLPYEGLRSFRSSFNDVYEMNPTELQLGFLKVLKGTPIEQDCEQYNILHEDTAPYEVLATRWLHFDELCHLKRMAEMVEIYYNSHQFDNTIALLLKSFDTPFDMYSALAEYYQENHFFTVTPARARRYEILLAFVDEKTTEHIEPFREALTLDYYLREKPKSRPDFVTNPPDKNLFDYEQRDPLTGNFLLREVES